MEEIAYFYLLQFGTQVKFRWSRDRNNRTVESAFSAPWYFSEMELELAAQVDFGQGFASNNILGLVKLCLQ